MEEMSFKDYSIFCPGGHLVQHSGTIWVIQQLFLESFIKIGHVFTEDMPFNKFFLYLALTAILCSRPEPFRQYW